MDRLVGDGDPLLLLQPLPGRCVTGAARRRRPAVAKAGLPRRGQAGSVAGGLGHGAPRGEPAGRLGGQPAAHGLPPDAEQGGHLTPGGACWGWRRERACKRRGLWASRAALRRAFSAAGVSWRDGRGVFMARGACPQACPQAIAPSVLRLGSSVNAN